MQHEVGIILRVKNLEEAKNQLKGVFSKEANKAAGDFNKKQDKVNEGFKETQKKSRVAGEGINDFVGRMFRSIAIIGLFNRALRTSVGLFEESAGFERGSRAFEAAVGRVEQHLPELRRATRNTVEDMRLLQTATRAVTEGLEQAQLGRAFEIATASARRMGRTVPESMDLVTRAMVRNDEAALRGLGIQVDKNEEYQALQTILGRLPGPANRLARIRHTENFIMTQLNRTYGDFNQVQADNLEILERARASIQNFRRDLGGFIAITLGPLINAFRVVTDSVSAFLRVIQERPELARLVGILGGVYAGLLAVKAGVKALRFVFQTLRLGKLFLAPLAALGPKGWAVIAALAGLEMLFNLTGKVGSAFDYVRTGVRAFIDLIRSYDPKTGLSQALKTDKEALGGMWKWVVRASRAFIVAREAGISFAHGVWDSLLPVRTLVRTIRDAIVGLGSALDSLVGSPVTRLMERVSGAFRGLDEPVTQDRLDEVRKLSRGMGRATGATAQLGIAATNPALAGTALAGGIGAMGLERFGQQRQETPDLSLGGDATSAIEQEQDRKEMLKRMDKLIDLNSRLLDTDQTRLRKEEQRILMNGGS